MDLCNLPLRGCVKIPVQTLYLLTFLSHIASFEAPPLCQVPPGRIAGPVTDGWGQGVGLKDWE